MITKDEITRARDDERERALVETMNTKAGRYSMWWILYGEPCALLGIPADIDPNSLALATGRRLAGDILRRELSRLAPMQTILMGDEAQQRRK